MWDPPIMTNPHENFEEKNSYLLIKLINPGNVQMISSEFSLFVHQLFLEELHVNLYPMVASWQVL